MTQQAQKFATTEEIVKVYMDHIVSLFKDDVKISVIVRTPDYPDRDFIISSDTPEDVRAAIERRMIAAGSKVPAPVEAWVPTHRHRKGGYYRVIDRGFIEAGKTPAVIYEDDRSTMWVRPAAEFYDGRFTRITTQWTEPPMRGDWFWMDGDSETGERTAEAAVRNYFELTYVDPTTVKLERAVELSPIFAAVRREDDKTDLTISFHHTEAEAQAALGMERGEL